MTAAVHQRFAVQTRATRLGLHCGLIATFAVIGGSVRGFNLMLVLAALMFGALLLSWRVASRAVAGISVHRRLPPEAIAGKPFEVQYRWRSVGRGGGRWIAAWLLRVDDVCSMLVQRPRAASGLIGTSTRTWTQVTGGLLGRGGRLKIRSSIAVVPPRETVLSTVEMTIGRRGAYQWNRMSVSTKFPMSLFECRSPRRQPQTIEVLPSKLRLRPDWRSRLRRHAGPSPKSSRGRGQSDGEFYSIRKWKRGDSQRSVHWRTTARLLEPAVRQYQQPRRTDVCIVLDAERPIDPSHDDATPGGNKITGGPRPCRRAKFENDFETAVSLAASLLCDVMQRSGESASLAIAADEVDWIADRRRDRRRRCLGQLARVQPSDQSNLAALVDLWATSPSRPRELLIVSTRSLETTLLVQPELTKRLSPWLRRGSLNWINVQDRIDWLVQSSASTTGQTNDAVRERRPPKTKSLEGVA